jgi:uncharacterized DUF497 family protein
MKLEWDETKNAVNIDKHGIDFADLAELFERAMLCRRDDRRDYGEERWIAIGTVEGRAMVVVFTEREPDIIRVMSARKANQRERQRYEQAIQKRQD